MMTTQSNIGKSISAALCALLFASTMILSAVGPARAGVNVVQGEFSRMSTMAVSPYLA